jgi:SAM-dependent methyltransferase
MSREIIGLHQWFETPPGRYLLEWEKSRFDAALTDIFGYHAVQLGLPGVHTLQSNRMPHQWMAACAIEHAEAPSLSLVADFAALPFAAQSLDLVVLPHTLELYPDPHATLREVERVLVPEGRVVISGLNPASLWGLRQSRGHLTQRVGWGELFLPEAGEFIGYRRLRDWLRLLNFEVEQGQFGCYRPAVRSQKWLGRFEWMDRAGDRWWPIFGAVYMIVAVKRVRGLRLQAPAWRSRRALTAGALPLANKWGQKNAVRGDLND